MKAFSPQRFNRHGIVAAILFIIGLIVGNFGLFYHNHLSLLKSQRTPFCVRKVGSWPDASTRARS